MKLHIGTDKLGTWSPNTSRPCPCSSSGSWVMSASVLEGRRRRSKVSRDVGDALPDQSASHLPNSLKYAIIERLVGGREVNSNSRYRFLNWQTTAFSDVCTLAKSPV